MNRSFFAFLFTMFVMTFVSHSQTDPLRAKALKIHQSLLTIDTHTDVPMVMVNPGFDIAQLHQHSDANNSTVDFPRMRAGGIDAMFYIVYLGQGPTTPEANTEAKNKAIGIAQTIHNAVKKYPEQATLALASGDAANINKSGKLAIYIGLENGYPIGEDLANVKLFYDLGCRYVTLCHSFNNLICDSSTDPKGAVFHGLSPFGEKVVLEMNRLGMMIDLSHVSDETVEDVLNLSKTPPIASHSNARAISDVPRNIPDHLIKKIAAKGGVVQVNFVNDFLKKPSPPYASELKEARERFLKAPESEQPKIRTEIKAIQDKYGSERASVSDIVKHIDYIAKLVGIDHVGIGSDFDGGAGVEGCRDVSEMPNITYELMKMGYSKKDLAKIWGGNLQRVFKAVENGAEK